MSGRLVILPHKSWNVWNQDNREKVARDERLHREAEEAKAEKDKQLLQEQNLELLRDGSLTTTLGSNHSGSSSSNGQVEPFRLFEDLEEQHYARIGNEDYLKEKAQKELLQKKRDGIADWALGEGSVENSKVKPWYETHNLVEFVSSSTSGPRSERETNRKGKADPMGTILKPNTYEYQPKAPSELEKGDRNARLSFLESAEAKLDCIESKEMESSDSESSKWKEKKHKKEHKSRKHSKHRHRHSESSDEERRDKKRKKSKHSPDATKIKTEGIQHKAPTADPWAELRAKRLDREATERKRAAVLLATVDVYGPGGAESARKQAQGYGQQYHPHLARQKR